MPICSVILWFSYIIFFNIWSVWDWFGNQSGTLLLLWNVKPCICYWLICCFVVVVLYDLCLLCFVSIALRQLTAILYMYVYWRIFVLLKRTCINSYTCRKIKSFPFHPHPVRVAKSIYLVTNTVWWFVMRSFLLWSRDDGSGISRAAFVNKVYLNKNRSECLHLYIIMVCNSQTMT